MHHIGLYLRVSFARLMLCIVTWCLKAGRAKPEEAAIDRQRPGKHAPVASDSRTAVSGDFIFWLSRAVNCCRPSPTQSTVSRGSSIIVCVSVAAGACIPSRCLAITAYSGSARPAFRRHDTVYFVCWPQQCKFFQAVMLMVSALFESRLGQRLNLTNFFRFLLIFYASFFIVLIIMFPVSFHLPWRWESLAHIELKLSIGSSIHSGANVAIECNYCCRSDNIW
jgi:hypothetical protein